MSKQELKITICVNCVMFISPLFLINLLLCVNPIASSNSQALAVMLGIRNEPSAMNSSHQENKIPDQTTMSGSMYQQQFPTLKDDSSWSDKLFKQLHHNARNDSTNFKNFSNIGMLSLPFLYNYEDYFPALENSIDSVSEYLPTLNESYDSILDSYDIWEDLDSYNGPNDFDDSHETNNNLTGRLSSLRSILSNLSNINGFTNTSISLSDIIISHHLTNKQITNYNEEKDRTPDNSINLPPWEDLTKIQKDAILQSALGSPQKYSNGTVSGLSFYYGALLSVGIPGNGLTILIIATNSYMRTAPNIFLLSIALADLLTLTLVVPLEVRMLFKSYPWSFDEFGCAAATTICELGPHVIIVTMIAFALERYFAICHPLKPSLQSGKVRTMIIILVIWIICLIPSLCWTVYSKVEYMFYSTTENPRLRVTKKEESKYINEGFVKIEESATCVVSPDSVTTTMASMTVITTLLLFVLPILILSWIYSRIAKALKESENYSQPITGNGYSGRNRRTVVRMQMAVITCFLLCWTPYHVQRIMFIILTRTESWSPHLMRIQETLHIVSGCCYFLSSAINPFLYSLLSKRFRRGFHDLTHKVIQKWIKKSPYSNYENQNNRPELVQGQKLPNNFSFCLKDRQVHNRNALKRHFNLPISAVIQSDSDLKVHQMLEKERQGIHDQNKSNSLDYKSSFDSFSEPKQVTIERLKIEDVKKITSTLKQKKNHLNCRYRVVFKSQSSRQKTTLIVNNCAQTPIPRCSGINDLRKVGSTSMSLVASSATLSRGTQTKERHRNFYSISEEKSRKSKPFLSTLSCQPCEDAYML